MHGNLKNNYSYAKWGTKVENRMKIGTTYREADELKYSISGEITRQDDDNRWPYGEINISLDVMMIHLTMESETS